MKHEASYAPLTKSDVYAIKALAEGKAEPAMQIDALNLIIERICGTYDLSYRPDSMGGQRATEFSEGKRSVGLQIRRIIAQPMKVLVPDDAAQQKQNGDLPA